MTATLEHNLTLGPAPTRDGITPNTDLIHVSTGKAWAGSVYLGWSTTLPEIAGCRFEPSTYEESSGRSFSQVVIGWFVHEDSGQIVAWAWRYYR